MVDNKLNLIINIELGKKAKIKKISFIGDKKFKKDNTEAEIMADDQLDQERREVWNNKRVAKGGRASKKPKIC